MDFFQGPHTVLESCPVRVTFALMLRIIDSDPRAKLKAELRGQAGQARPNATGKQECFLKMTFHAERSVFVVQRKAPTSTFELEFPFDQKFASKTDRKSLKAARTWESKIILGRFLNLANAEGGLVSLVAFKEIAPITRTAPGEHTILIEEPLPLRPGEKNAPGFFCIHWDPSNRELYMLNLPYPFVIHQVRNPLRFPWASRIELDYCRASTLNVGDTLGDYLHDDGRMGLAFDAKLNEAGFKPNDEHVNGCYRLWGKVFFSFALSD